MGQQGAGQRASANLSFCGDKLYSYSTPIARHVSRKGQSAVLLTTRDHSHTTAGHKEMVKGACRHLRVFNVENVAEYHTDHRERFGAYRKRFMAIVSEYAKARRRKPIILDRLRELVSEANQYAEFFGLRSRLTLPTDLTGMVAECRAIERREAARRQREQTKREKESQERFQKWIDGETDYLPDSMFSRLSPIRLRVKGDELQTSLGARVPLDHAVKAFRVLKRLRDRGETYQRNGHTIHLGHFALDALDGQGIVTAGCHRVEWSEIERVATLAGVNEEG